MLVAAPPPPAPSLPCRGPDSPCPPPPKPGAQNWFGCIWFPRPGCALCPRARDHVWPQRAQTAAWGAPHPRPGTPLLGLRESGLALPWVLRAAVSLGPLSRGFPGPTLIQCWFPHPHTGVPAAGKGPAWPQKGPAQPSRPPSPPAQAAVPLFPPLCVLRQHPRWGWGWGWSLAGWPLHALGCPIVLCLSSVSS